MEDNDDEGAAAAADVLAASAARVRSTAARHASRSVGRRPTAGCLLVPVLLADEGAGAGAGAGAAALLATVPLLPLFSSSGVVTGASSSIANRPSRGSGDAPVLLCPATADTALALGLGSAMGATTLRGGAGGGGAGAGAAAAVPA